MYALRPAWRQAIHLRVGLQKGSEFSCRTGRLVLYYGRPCRRGWRRAPECSAFALKLRRDKPMTRLRSKAATVRRAMARAWGAWEELGAGGFCPRSVGSAGCSLTINKVQCPRSKVRGGRMLPTAPRLRTCFGRARHSVRADGGQRTARPTAGRARRQSSRA